MKKVPYIEQMTEIECGLCSCLSVMHYYKNKETIYELRRECERGRDGYSFKNLRDFFEKRDFEVNSFRVNDLNKIGKNNLPCIAFWDSDHFVVLYKIKRNNVYIMNPACGYEKLSIEDANEHFSNAIMIAKPKENYRPRKKQIPSPWKKVLKYIYQNKVLLLIAMVLAIINYAIVLIIPEYTTNIIDVAISGDGLNQFSTWITIIICFLLIYMVSMFTRSISLLFSNLLLSRKMEKQTFRHLLNLPYKYFESRPTGDIVYRISGQSAFRELFTSQVISGAIDFGTILVVFVFIFSKSIFLGWIAVLLSVFNFIFLLVTKEPLSLSINHEIQEQGHLQTDENECIMTMPTIKTAGLEDIMYEKWSKKQSKLMDRYKERYLISYIYGAVTGTFQVFAPIIIMILGIYQVYIGKMSIGQVVALQSLSSSLFASEVDFFTAYTQFLLADSYLERVNDIWCEEEEKTEGRTNEVCIDGRIEIKNLDFSYSKQSQKVLHNFSITINKGERIALVGKSGSGKSSIAKIIAGLYEVNNGQVYIDGHDINKIKKECITGQISMVPQDVTLLNQSIYSNISLGNEKITMDDVINISKAVNIYDEIMEMPMGFYTIVSELGLNLSGGQRQRIALARALVSNPKIVVLDEATSSLDAENEKQIVEYLRKQGCTQVIVAHRLSTIKDADRIFVVDQGEIVESGTHDELMALKNVYYQLYITKEVNCDEL